MISRKYRLHTSRESHRILPTPSSSTHAYALIRGKTTNGAPLPSPPSAPSVSTLSLGDANSYLIQSCLYTSVYLQHDNNYEIFVERGAESAGSQRKQSIPATRNLPAQPHQTHAYRGPYLRNRGLVTAGHRQLNQFL